MTQYIDIVVADLSLSNMYTHTFIVSHSST